jgi:hypothetical protein
VLESKGTRPASHFAKPTRGDGKTARLGKVSTLAAECSVESPSMWAIVSGNASPRTTCTGVTFDPVSVDGRIMAVHPRPFDVMSYERPPLWCYTQYAGVCHGSINISQKSIQVDMLGDTGSRKHGLAYESCQH